MTVYTFTATTAGSATGTGSRTASFTVSAPGGVNFAANPSAHGYPDATNTGATGTLTALVAGTARSGTGWSWSGTGLTISGNGTVFANFSIPGLVTVTGTNVTMRNCKVVSPGFTSNGITVGGAGYLIDGCTVQGADANQGGLDAGIKGLGGNNVSGTIQFCNIFNARSPIQDVGGAVRNCYLHDPRNAAGDHINGLKRDGGSEPLLVEHNTIFNQYDQTGCVVLIGYFGREANDTVNDNLLAGGGYAIYGGGGSAGGDPANIKITNNRISSKYFAKGGYWGWIAYNGTAAEGCVTSGNIWDATGLPAT